MERRRVYDRVAEIYEELRPFYPEKVFTLINRRVQELPRGWGRNRLMNFFNLLTGVPGFAALKWGQTWPELSAFGFLTK